MLRAVGARFYFQPAAGWGACRPTRWLNVSKANVFNRLHELIVRIGFFFFPRRLNAFNVVFWQHFQLLSTLISRGKRYHLQVSKSKDYVSLSVTAGERGSLQPMSPEWQAGANYRTYGNVFLLFFLFFLVLSHFGPCSESSVTVRQAVIISARMELMYSSSFANPTWWCCTGRELKDLVWDHFVGF